MSNKNMEYKKIFPKGFFTKERFNITMKESLEDIIPIDWEEQGDKIDPKLLNFVENINKKFK